MSKIYGKRDIQSNPFPVPPPTPSLPKQFEKVVKTCHCQINFLAATFTFFDHFSIDYI